MTQLLSVALGFLAGVFGGLFGIGGAVIVIPGLVYLFGLSQHQAQGTTLAMMVPPVGLLAAWSYYQTGNVKLPIAVFLCLGFFIGGLAGGLLAQHVPALVMKKMFGVLLLLISLHMIVSK